MGGVGHLVRVVGVGHLVRVVGVGHFVRGRGGGGGGGGSVIFSCGVTNSRMGGCVEIHLVHYVTVSF